MQDKDKLHHQRGGSQSSHRSQSSRTTECLGQSRGAVHFYEGKGIKLQSHLKAPNLKQIGGKRGTISKWSSASRRRLRSTLLELGPPDDWATCGLTFTVPGPVLSTEQYVNLWHWFSLQVVKAKLGMIWRVEIQERGAWHWHCIGIGGAGKYRTRYAGDCIIGECSKSAGDLQVSIGLVFRDLWFAALDNMGPQTFDPPYAGSEGKWRNPIVRVESLASMPGADVHAVDISWDRPGFQGAWLRYLQDHASKAKQAQIGLDVGRHWGVVGRKHFVKVPESEAVNLTDREWARFIRALQRLATPSFPNPEAPFGRSLGGRVRRGSSHGSSVWFSNTATIRKLALWAKSESASGVQGSPLPETETTPAR